jgi:hypothetical protein
MVIEMADELSVELIERTLALLAHERSKLLDRQTR